MHVRSSALPIVAQKGRVVDRLGASALTRQTAADIVTMSFACQAANS